MSRFCRYFLASVGNLSPYKPRNQGEKWIQHPPVIGMEFVPPNILIPKALVGPKVCQGRQLRWDHG